MNPLTKFIGARPHKSEWTSLKGEESVNREFGKDRLCILPNKQWVQGWSTILFLFNTNLTLGNKLLRAWSWGWPSLIC